MFVPNVKVFSKWSPGNYYWPQAIDEYVSWIHLSWKPILIHNDPQWPLWLESSSSHIFWLHIVALFCDKPEHNASKMPATLIHENSVPWDRSQPRARMLWDVDLIRGKEHRPSHGGSIIRTGERLASWVKLVFVDLLMLLFVWRVMSCNPWKTTSGQEKLFQVDHDRNQQRRAMQHIYIYLPRVSHCLREDPKQILYTDLYPRHKWKEFGLFVSPPLYHGF